MKEKLITLLKNQLQNIGVNKENITIEIPKNKENGDYSSNIALQIAKELHTNPMDVAEKLIANISEDWLKDIVIAKPGFINFYVKNDYLLDNINFVLEKDNNYGSCNIGQCKKINIEFVSANPTGILHIGNARGGAYGDSLARIMKFCGYDVTKEYYLNDAGNQINKLGKSIYSRYLTKCGIPNEFPKDGYQGEEITIIADLIYNNYGNKLVDGNIDIFKQHGIDYLTKSFELSMMLLHQKNLYMLNTQ